MLPPTCVVVPTYWGRADGEVRPGDAAYDHPTPVDGHSTLPALLESIALLDTSSFYLLVLVAVTTDEVIAQAEHRVQEIVSGYSSLVSLVFGPSQLGRLHQEIGGAGLAAETSYIELLTYPKVRNLQLAIPHALGSEAIVALDDDEIVDDATFLDRATEPLGMEIEGNRVDGLSGHYIQPTGGVLLQVDPAKAASANIFDRKAAIMNAGTEQLDAEPGDIVETPFCFGGNMEFTAGLVASVGFDPGITRGEDIDYLINARMEGRRFFLRKDLTILHRPPAGGSYKDASISKLQQDVIRFIYEQEKLHASQRSAGVQPVTASELMPYPGEFLAAPLQEDAVEALEAAGYAGRAAEFVKGVAERAQDRVEEYLVFRERWPRLMEGLRECSGVREQLMGLVKGI